MDAPMSRSRIFDEVEELPNELSQMIKEEVLLASGEDVTNSLAKSVLLRNKISCIQSEYMAVAIICNMFDICLESDRLRRLYDDVIDGMGIGYCYLKCIEMQFRFQALKLFYAWPSLGHVLCHFEESLLDKFYVQLAKGKDSSYHLHMVPELVDNPGSTLITFHNQCNRCHSVSTSDFWSRNPSIDHDSGCDGINFLEIICTPLEDHYLNSFVGGILSRLRSGSNNHRNSKSSRPRAITDSTLHQDAQVLKFQKSVKGDGIEPDMSRDLYSVPKPTEIETMADHLNNHKSGDIFPYVSVVGNEEETKDGRLSRLRAFRSSYGKENKPEMRINGVILDELEGTIKVKHLGEYVNKDRLNKQQKAENKRFRPIDEASFKKPYIQLSRITGEYVPLMSSTSDYTELYFTLEDGRLLDNQTIVQSNKLPTNQNGVFELSCDYCINLNDVEQLSLKYFLSRPIMKEGFQWGSVSLTIRVSESDTPYLTPKVEAMAIARIPFTTLEDQTKDPDHADVVYTAKQVEKFKELYRAGDVMDIDEAKRERTKINSYSKSTIRGAVKGESGPSHLGNQSGWEHLKGMVKPRIEEGVASVSAASGSEEADIDVPSTTREEYERQQEALRAQFQSPMSDTTEEIPLSDLHRSSSPISEKSFPNIGEVSPPRPALKSAIKKPRFNDEELQEPNTSDVYKFN